MSCHSLEGEEATYAGVANIGGVEELERGDFKGLSKAFNRRVYEDPPPLLLPHYQADEDEGGASTLGAPPRPAPPPSPSPNLSARRQPPASACTRGTAGAKRTRLRGQAESPPRPGRRTSAAGPTPGFGEDPPNRRVNASSADAAHRGANPRTAAAGTCARMQQCAHPNPFVQIMDDVAAHQGRQPLPCIKGLDARRQDPRCVVTANLAIIELTGAGYFLLLLRIFIHA
jgi:hypothetical protein